MNKLFQFLKSLFAKKEVHFALGAFPNEPDNRDIKYTDIVGIAKITDPKITVPNFLETPRLLQGPLGTCVEYCFEFIKRVDDKIIHSRRVPYVVTRNFLGWTEANGQGLPQREGAKVACTFGTPKDTGIDNTSLPHNLYTQLEITQEMRDDANIYKMGGFSFPDKTVNGIKQSLANGKLVAVTIPIDWSKIDADGTVHPAVNIAGYHEVAIGQSDDSVQKFRAANWWGYDLYFQYDEIEQIIADAINFVEIPEDLILRAKQTPFVFTQNLSFGMNLDAVTQLQKKLSLIGLYNSSFDRQFGLKTLQAVKDFQRIKGLVSDGIVGPLTRALLNS
jgi:hypothetical protein